MLFGMEETPQAWRVNKTVYKICRGMERNIFLQLDWWQPDDILYTRYGYVVVYDVASSL